MNKPSSLPSVLLEAGVGGLSPPQLVPAPSALLAWKGSVVAFVGALRVTATHSYRTGSLSEEAEAGGGTVGGLCTPHNPGEGERQGPFNYFCLLPINRPRPLEKP